MDSLFRCLREAWFNCTIRSYAHEREWEDEERSKRREKDNEESWAMFNAQTEFIIANKHLADEFSSDETNTLRPYSCHDIWRSNQKYKFYGQSQHN